MLTGNASIVQPASFRSIFKGRKVMGLRPGIKEPPGSICFCAVDALTASRTRWHMVGRGLSLLPAGRVGKPIRYQDEHGTLPPGLSASHDARRWIAFWPLQRRNGHHLVTADIGGGDGN